MNMIPLSGLITQDKRTCIDSGEAQITSSHLKVKESKSTAFARKNHQEQEGGGEGTRTLKNDHSTAFDPTPLDLKKVTFVQTLPKSSSSCLSWKDSLPAEESEAIVETLMSIFPSPNNSKAPDSLSERARGSAMSYNESNSDLSMASSSSSSSNEVERTVRFRALKSEQWFEKFQDLVQYKRDHGDCLVSHSDPRYRSLAQWVKRQRYQYKLRQDGHHSNLTDERLQALTELGFAWSSHEARWEDRFEELKEFLAIHGHCKVPKRYEPNLRLSVWVKCQRRMYKAILKGKKPTTLTPERVELLNKLGFHWGKLGGNRL